MSLHALAQVVRQVALSAAVVLSTGDPARGAVVYRERCASCHGATGEGHDRLGPTLGGVLGRYAGNTRSFRGSRALRAAGEDGLVWSTTNLDRYLAHPAKVIPGTLMRLRTLRIEDREDVIAYLATLSQSRHAKPR